MCTNCVPVLADKKQKEKNEKRLARNRTGDISGAGTADLPVAHEFSTVFVVLFALHDL
jgi:NCAIR mutase (PurE)-related protein